MASGSYRGQAHGDAYVLRTEDLTKTYQPPAGVRRILMRSPISEAITAVDRVNISVRRGEVLGLLGPNGAGKTTLIKMLATLLAPTSGRAWVCGHDVVAQEGLVRQSIGIAFGEDRSFYYRLTGRQNLAFFATLANVEKSRVSERVEAALAVMDLSHDGDNMYYSYSSGMRQKLSIARTLLGDPEMLFLDEPTKNVDALAGNDLKRLIKEKLSGASGRSVLLATHRMEEAEQLCDRIAIVRSGRIAFCGTIPELRRMFGGAEECVLRVGELGIERCSEFVRHYRLDRAALDRPGGNGVVEMRFQAPTDGAKLTHLLRGVLDAGGTVVSVDRHERALEEMFVDVVRARREC